MVQCYGNPGKGSLPIDMLLWAMKEADSPDAGQRQRWAAHCYLPPAQAPAQEVQQDNDELQIIALLALHARRHPPPITVIDEHEDKEEVWEVPNPN